MNGFQKLAINLCSLVRKKGYNVKEFLSWKKALLSKWIWKLIANGDGMWTKRFSYNLNGSIWEAVSKLHHYYESWGNGLQVRDQWVTCTSFTSDASTLLTSSVSGDKFITRKAHENFRHKFDVVGGIRLLRMLWWFLIKHKIISSLAIRNACLPLITLFLSESVMLTSDVFCDKDMETYMHLFFRCQCNGGDKDDHESDQLDIDLRNGMYKLSTDSRRKNWRNCWLSCSRTTI